MERNISHIFGHMDVGESVQPIRWRTCGYCGGAIDLGMAYYLHDGLAICTECAHRYAWACFEENAVRRYAAPNTPLWLPP